MLRDIIDSKGFYHLVALSIFEVITLQIKFEYCRITLAARLALTNLALSFVFLIKYLLVSNSNLITIF